MSSEGIVFNMAYMDHAGTPFVANNDEQTSIQNKEQYMKLKEKYTKSLSEDIYNREQITLVDENKSYDDNQTNNMKSQDDTLTLQNSDKTMAHLPKIQMQDEKENEKEKQLAWSEGTLKSYCQYMKFEQTHYNEHDIEHNLVNIERNNVSSNTFIDGNYTNKVSINGLPYQQLRLQKGCILNVTFQDISMTMLIDNGSTISLMAKSCYDKYKQFHELPMQKSNIESIQTGNGEIKAFGFVTIPLNLPNKCTMQCRFLVCDTTCTHDLILGLRTLQELLAIQKYEENLLLIRFTTIPLQTTKYIKLPSKRSTAIQLQPLYRDSIYKYLEHIDEYTKVLAWQIPTWPTDPYVLYELHVINGCVCVKLTNLTENTIEIPPNTTLGFLDTRQFHSEEIQENTQQNTLFAHAVSTVASSIDPTELANESLIPDQPGLLVRDKPIPIPIQKTQQDADPYPWLEPDDPRRHMSDRQILEKKIDLSKSTLTDAQKIAFLDILEEFKDVFSLRDEIGTCPNIEAKLVLRDETPFYVKPYPIREEQKKIVQREIQRLSQLGIIQQGLTGYSSPVLLVKRKQQNLYRVVTDFRVLNNKMMRINHAFPLVRDCMEAMGKVPCDVMSVIDLRDAYHTIRLTKDSQKYCGITPFYGSPTYHYLRLGMGISASPAIWQQFVDHLMTYLQQPDKFKIIMDDIATYSQFERHIYHLIDLFKTLRRFGLKISPHKCQFYRQEFIYMGIQFMIRNQRVCYKAMKDKLEAIINMKQPRNVAEVRRLCGMLNFLASFLERVRHIAIPILNLTKKKSIFQWTSECEEAFQECKKLCQKPPILWVPIPGGLFRLESDTSHEATGAALLQKQENEWKLIGFHSKRLPNSVRNYGAAELELCGLITNIHGFVYLLKNRYFEILVDHRAIEYLVKAKHEPTTRRLTMMLLKLQEYQFDLKYLNGCKMYVSDALSRLYIEDTHKIDEVIPLDFLVHFTDSGVFHQYKQLAQNLYDAISNKNTHYTHPVRRSKRLQTIETDKKLDTAAQNTDNRQQLAIKQTSKVAKIKKQSAKTNYPLIRQHTEIGRKINKALAKTTDDDILQSITETYRPVDDKLFTKNTSVFPNSTDKKIVRKHIPQQKEIDKLLEAIKTKVLHHIQVPLASEDLIASYKNSPRYQMIYQYIQNGLLPGNKTTQAKIQNESQNFITIDSLLCRIPSKPDKYGYDTVQLVIPEQFEQCIFDSYHKSLLALHQGPYKTFLTIRKRFYIPNLLNKLKRYTQACDLCQRSNRKSTKQAIQYPRIPTTYSPMSHISADIKFMPKGINGYAKMLVVTCEFTNFTVAIPLQQATAQSIAEALIHRVIAIFGIPDRLIVDKDRGFTGQIVKILLTALKCEQKIISPFNHGSSKTERQIQTIGNMITKQLTEKGMNWPHFAAIAAYAMNTFSSEALDGLSPFELVFVRSPKPLTEDSVIDLHTVTTGYKEWAALLNERAKLVRSLFLEWKIIQAQLRTERLKQSKAIKDFVPGDIVYLLAPHASSLQTDTTKFRLDYVGPLVVERALDSTHYILRDLIGRTLPDVYHINRLKQGALQTTTGTTSNIKTLTDQDYKAITPNDENAVCHTTLCHFVSTTGSL